MGSYPDVGAKDARKARDAAKLKKSTGVEAIELLATVRRVEERGALDVAHRVLTTAGQVWRYAVATGRTPRDITADILGASAQRRVFDDKRKVYIQ